MISLSTVSKKILKEADSPADQIAKAFKMPMAQFASNFKSIAGDAKVQAVLKAGAQDGNAKDEQISYSDGTVSVSGLIPTQNIIGTDESLANILDDKYGSLNTFLEGKANVGGKIVIYNGKYIVDGHHRWSQVYAANPKATIDCVDLKGKLSALNLLKVVHMAIAADIGSLPLSDASGKNMLTADEGTIVEIVKTGLKPKVLDIYKKFGKGKNNDEVAKYIWKNVKLMQSKNKPVSGAPDRSAMPQTDKAPGFKSHLQKGAVNFLQPKDSDVKTESFKPRSKNKMKNHQKLEQLLREVVRKQIQQIKDSNK